MSIAFNRTVSAIAETIVHDMPSSQALASTEMTDSVSHFILQTYSRMPDYLRFPLRVLTIVFDAWSLLTTGRLFHRLPYERRSRQIRVWRHSILSPMRDFVKFYDTLSSFGWYFERYAQDYARPENSETEYA
jgi:hypothetical protein